MPSQWDKRICQQLTEYIIDDANREFEKAGGGSDLFHSNSTLGDFIENAVRNNITLHFNYAGPEDNK